MQDKKLTSHETQRLVEHAINYVSQQELALLLGLPASRVSEAKKGKHRLTNAEMEKVEHEFGPVVTEKGDWLIAELLTDDMSLANHIKNMIKAFESLDELRSFDKKLEDSFGRLITFFIPEEPLEDPGLIEVTFLEPIPRGDYRKSFDNLIHSSVVRAFYESFGELLSDKARAARFREKLRIKLKDIPNLGEDSDETFEDFTANLGFHVYEASPDKELEKHNLIYEAIMHANRYQSVLGGLGMALPGKLSFSNLGEGSFAHPIKAREYIISAQHLLTSKVSFGSGSKPSSVCVDVYLGQHATHYVVAEVCQGSNQSRKLIKSNVPYKKLVATLNEITEELGVDDTALVDSSFKTKLAKAGGYIPTAELLK